MTERNKSSYLQIIIDTHWNSQDEFTFCMEQVLLFSNGFLGMGCTNGICITLATSSPTILYKSDSMDNATTNSHRCDDLVRTVETNLSAISNLSASKNGLTSALSLTLCGKK